MNLTWSRPSKNLGIEIVFAEELSFREQVDLFSSAELIVGPHGAGLTNLIRSLCPGRVVEVFPHRFFNSCYARLGAMRGFEYRHVASDEDHASAGVIPIADVLNATGLVN